MATITVTGRSARYPVGTSVGLYPRQAIPAGSGIPKGPSGSAIVSATVDAAGVLTFSDPLVVTDVPYVAYALVAGEHRPLQVSASTPFAVAPTWKTKVAARRAAIGTS